jgi:hypothetical protein
METPRASFEEGRFSRSSLLQQLDRIVCSKHFRNSKRYPPFLRFVVEQTLAGKTEELKERTLGVEVFARRSDYDTNADPIVRVTAGEVRKRIAQYYQEPGHENELRIELPLGSYVPHFLPPAQATHNVEHDHLHDHFHDHLHADIDQTGVSVATTPGRGHEVIGPNTSMSLVDRRVTRILLFALLPVLVITACWTGILLRNRSRDKGINYFWNPVIASGNPALIVIGVHSLDNTGQDKPVNTQASSGQDENESMLTSMIRSDMVPVSDIVSYSKVTDLLTRRNSVYRTKGSADTKIEDLRQGPVILIGGLDNVWTMRLVSPLRYTFFASTKLESEIRDNKDSSRVWKFNNMQSATGNTRDYAIVASYFDPTIEQHVLIVAGIGKAGTQAAAEFLTSNQHPETWLAESKPPQNKNIELVLSTEILDGEPGPPHVLASAVW